MSTYILMTEVRSEAEYERNIVGKNDSKSFWSEKLEAKNYTSSILREQEEMQHSEEHLHF